VVSIATQRQLVTRTPWPSLWSAGPVIAERPRAGGAPGLSVRMSAEDTAEVMIYGRIGGGGFFDEGGITSAALAETLSGIKASNIHVRINSGGGDVFEGVAIHTLLRRHPATVTTFVDGLAASAASFIAQAGDRIVMARNAMMMIHDGMTGGYGNADTMRRTADLLDKVSANIADMYAARAGEDAEHWRALMIVNGEDGSWFTGQEAVDAGLADEITDADEEDAPVSALMAQWSGLLTRAPENVQAHLTTLLAQEQADSAPDPDAPDSAPDAPDEDAPRARGCSGRRRHHGGRGCGRRATRGRRPRIPVRHADGALARTHQQWPASAPRCGVTKGLSMATPTAVPTTPDELQEALTDRKLLTNLMADPEGKAFPEFLTNYVNAFGKANTDVEKDVQDQIDRTLANFAREHMVDLKGRLDMRPKTTEDGKIMRQTAGRYSAQADGAALDGKFGSLMDFLETVHSGKDPREDGIAEKRRMIKNAMSSTDPASGGFLIPEQFRAELLRVALESAVVRPRARVIPMASLRAAIPMIDSTSNSSSVYGGVIAYWTEEGAALTQSQPAFGRIVLEAKKLTAYTEVPNELREDSAITVDALLNDIFPEAVAWFEDIAFLSGTGVGEPLGVLNTANTATVSVTKETGQAANTIVWENLVKMYSRMLPASLGRAVWVVSPDTFPELATMALSVGTGGSAVWLNNGVDGPPATILGRPVIISEKVAALSTAGDVNFIDFGQYLIGDRMAMDAQVSTDYKFGNDMTAYRFIERVDGRPWLQSAVTPKNGSTNTLSPYVQLGAR
jgi:HK97 family phage major capsid protein